MPRISLSRFSFAFTVLTAQVALLLAVPVQAGDVPSWPQFRGPGGNAIALNQSIPLEFGPDKNVRWKAPLPRGHSSPIIWGDRIFITGHEGTTLRMICLSRADGHVLWNHERQIEKVPTYEHVAGDPAASTPATDGRRVVFHFDDYGMVVTDLDGKQLWEKKFPPTANPYSYGASPIIEGDRIYLNRDGGIDSSLLCLDLESGEERWRAWRPQAYFSFCTPYLFGKGGQRQVLAGGTGGLNAYDPQTGEPIWNVTGLPIFQCPSPVEADGMIYFGGWTTAHVSGQRRIDSVFDEASGVSEAARKDPKVFMAEYDTNRDGRLEVDEFPPSRARDAFNFVDKNKNGFVEFEEFASGFADTPGSPGRNVFYGIASGGMADITETHVKWETIKGLPYVSSPLVYKGRLYLVRDGGLLTCLNPKTGEPIFSQERLGVAGEYYATPIGVGEHLILCAQRGTVLIVKSSDQFEISARNRIGENLYATPAIVENMLYLRGDEHLWAFGE